MPIYKVNDDPLTGRQAAFCRKYVECWNGAQAARKAGYKDGPGIYATASQLLKNPKVKGEIERLSREQTLGKHEVTARLTSHARADVTDFFSPVYAVDDEGNETDEVINYRLDLNKAIEAGKTHLIKKIWQDRSGQIQVVLHDAQAALVQLGRRYGLWIDKVAPTNPNGEESWLRFDTVVSALNEADKALEEKE